MNRNGPLVQFTHHVRIDALQTLWETCFPEDAAGFAQCFLEQYYVPDRAVCVVGEDGSTLESALYWMPCIYRIGDRQGTFLYIYAMGTHPNYRRRGNLRAMLEFVEQHCIVRGIDGIILHAMDTSKSSVEAFGMKPLLTLGKELHMGADTQAGDWCPGTFDDFQTLRTQYLSKLPGCVYWEEEELRFVYEDLCRDGKLFFFREEDGLHYGVIARDEDGVWVEETDCEDGLLTRVEGPVTVCHPGEGVYGAHVKIYEKSLQEQDLCKLYYNLMLK